MLMRPPLAHLLDATQANSMLTYMHGGGAPRTLTTPKLRLMITVGSAGSNGTEAATGGGYTAATGLVLSWAAASAQSQATNAIASVTNYPRAETVNGVEVWSTDATPLRIELGSLTTPKVMAAGDTLSFASGAITSALA